MRYVEFCLKAIRTPSGGLSIVDVAGEEVGTPKPLQATMVDAQGGIAQMGATEPYYSICFTLPLADDHVQVATQVAIDLGLDSKALIDVCAEAEVVSFDGGCPFCADEVRDKRPATAEQSAGYTLTTIELHRRLSDGRLTILGINKKPVKEPVEFSVVDMADWPAVAKKVAHGVAYLFRYTTSPAQEWDSSKSWDEVKWEKFAQMIARLIVDPDDVYWLSIWADVLWGMDDDAIVIDEEPSPETIATYWSDSTLSDKAALPRLESGNV